MEPACPQAGHNSPGRAFAAALCLTETHLSARDYGLLGVKMIAYRAETASVGLLRPHLAKEEEARALIRELLVSSADIVPNSAENTLTIHVHASLARLMIKP